MPESKSAWLISAQQWIMTYFKLSTWGIMKIMLSNNGGGDSCFHHLGGIEAPANRSQPVIALSCWSSVFVIKCQDPWDVLESFSTHDSAYNHMSFSGIHMENTNRYKSEDKKVNKAPKLINKLALSLSAFHSHIESQYNHRDLIFVYYEIYPNYKKNTGHKRTRT